MKSILCPLVLAFIASPVPAEDSKNVLYKELVKDGIQIPDGPKFKLPAPLLEPGQQPKNTMELLEKASGRVPVDLFLRQTVTAPFSLDISSVDKAKEERCGQLITLRFVAYGKLESAMDADFLKQLLTGKPKPGRAANESVALTSKELEKRGIRVVKQPNVKDEYGTLLMTLLDKVQVEGITHSIHVNVPNCVIYATKLDERFKDDQEYPNRWRSIKQVNEKEKLGPKVPYSGLGGYVIVTKLPEPTGALFIEAQFLLHEPFEWFDGFNLLRSKMPTAIQDNVRSFRRKLAKDADQ